MGTGTGTTHKEILELEEKLKQAELVPDPDFFQEHLDENMILIFDQKACSPKAHIVDAHRPEKGNKFTRVEMSDMKIVDHGNTAVVTCEGTYEGPNGTPQR